MTDDEFEDPNSRRSSSTLTAEEAFRIIDERFDAWEEQSTRGKRRALAAIYQLSAEMPPRSELFLQAIVKVQERPDFQERKRRWDPKTPFELLLTHRYGFSRENASLKSNLLKTLNQAQVEGVEQTEAAFLDWIEGVGGEEKARWPEKREPPNIEEVSEGFDTPGEAEGALELDMPADEELPGGLCVIVAKEVGREGNRRLLHPIEILTDERRVARIATQIAKGRERQAQQEMRQQQRERAREQKRQQKIDEHGHRPPKRSRAKKRKHSMPPLGFRRKKAKGSTLPDSLDASAKQPEQRE